MPYSKPAKGGVVRRRTSKGLSIYVRKTSKPKLIKAKKPSSKKR